MRTLRRAGLLTIALLCASNNFAQDRREIPAFRVYGEPAQASRTAIDEVMARFKRAWGSQDANALMALHANDVEWINAFGRVLRGAEPLRDFLENRLFPESDPSVSKAEADNMKLISLRYLADTAVVHMYTDSPRGPSRNEGESTRRTHIHLVLSQQSGRWEIVHTAIMDVR